MRFSQPLSSIAPKVQAGKAGNQVDRRAQYVRQRRLRASPLPYLVLLTILLDAPDDELADYPPRDLLLFKALPLTPTMQGAFGPWGPCAGLWRVTWFARPVPIQSGLPVFNRHVIPT